jgi:hypothetical protein
LGDFAQHTDNRYVEAMTQVDDSARTLNLRASVRRVAIVSILALAYSAYRVYSVLADMFARLAHRTAGISMTWNPGFPAPQPHHGHFSGAPFVAQGTTAYFTAMTGTVKDLPIGAIVFPSVSELLTVLTTAGIAVCVFILCRKVASGAPFARTSVRTLVVLAVVVFVGYEAATVLAGLGNDAIPSILLGAPSEPDGSFSPPEALFAFFTFWPVYISLALLALATVFRAGGRYQADSSGLV